MVTSCKMHAFALSAIWKALLSEAILTFHTGSRETERQLCEKSRFGLELHFLHIKAPHQGCSPTWPGSGIYYWNGRSITAGSCAYAGLITVTEVFRTQSLLCKGQVLYIRTVQHGFNTPTLSLLRRSLRQRHFILRDSAVRKSQSQHSSECEQCNMWKRWKWKEAFRR